MQVIRKLSFVIVIVFALLGITVAYFTSEGGPVNPAKQNPYDDPRAGRDYAIIYNSDEFFPHINQDERIFRLAQEDLALFAKTTSSAFINEQQLIGFTFSDGFATDGEMYVHTGFYYGLEEEIELKVQYSELGFAILSITNTVTGANIDDALQLNGQKSTVLRQLPIEEERYSIRYLNSSNDLVVTFYLGYTQQDIQAVSQILKTNSDDSLNDGVIYNINSVGRVTFDEVVKFTNSPQNTP